MTKINRPKKRCEFVHNWNFKHDRVASKEIRCKKRAIDCILGNYYCRIHSPIRKGFEPLAKIAYSPDEYALWCKNILGKSIKKNKEVIASEKKE